MPITFASAVLSRASLLAAAVFAYCAWMAYSMDRESRTNRLAVLFNAVFALWAGAASFWYGTYNRETAMALYRYFSWTWSVFPPIILHFSLRATGSTVMRSRARIPLLLCLYAPAAALCFLTPVYVLADPVYRGGYWMLAINRNAAYFFFVVHYFIIVVAAITHVFVASAKTADRRASRRYAILGWSYLSAGLLGFITDTVFLNIGLDFPNMAIIWIQILSIGMIVAMRRYGFLSILPAGEALSVLESMAEFVFYLDDAGRVVWANPSGLAALGVSSLGQARLLRSSDFLPPDIAASIGDAEKDAYDPRGVSSSLGPDAIPVNLWIHAVKDAGADGLVLTAVDRRPEVASARTKRRLADAGTLLDEFIARSLDGIVLTDADGRVVRWNNPMATMTGMVAEEAIGRRYQDLWPAIESASGAGPGFMRTSIGAMLSGREPSRARSIKESETLSRDGTKRIVQYDFFPIPLTDGTIFAIIARDITDERRLAEENIERIRKLDHAQKMEAVGTLSGGIAHDFNNTLAGIIGAASLIRQGMESEGTMDMGDISRELDMIERSSKRAASSVRRLMTLTRKRSPESVVFRLDEALGRVVEFAERSVDQSVTIETRPGLPEASVLGDEGQLEQLLLNLIINAEHAMTIMRQPGQKRGGVIRIAVYAFRPDAAFLQANPDVIDADYWAVSVRDEGVGVPRHIQNRIFDPFYTTKPTDSSSGLGLAMVHAIAHQHGGFVDLVSEPGAGAEFLVYLPVASAVSPSDRPTTRIGRGSGLVLVADDDDIPRETAVALLEAMGYAVVVASGGREALERFSERPDEWKAVVLDLRMGDSNGDAAAREMRASRPDLPIVLASGLHDEVAVDSYGFGAHCEMLYKPYTINDLGRALEKALGP
ncbi:MAG: hypothetical protein CVV47_09805 [Spirochaetae bacterium HGW-Spirochaetae-3]|nr:MAG: hypothetical protein CVV47_09805 [Spirochaetae bacterium HGW-Spirochaetae-3]